MIIENEQQSDFRKGTGYRRNQRGVPFTNTLGKLPPQARDMEEAILGALMLEKDAFFEVSQMLSAEIFYVEAHQRVYKAIKSLSDKGSPVDILTVTAELRSAGELEMVGGAYYITELTNRVASSANISYHTAIVYQKYLQRELIRLGTEVINSGYEDTTDVLELIEHHQADLFKLMNFNYARDAQGIDSLIAESVKKMRMPNTTGITGIPSGYPSMDKLSGGWQDTDLTIVAARPGMGKTAFVLNCARNAAVDFDKPVVIFSLEMSARQLVNRLISGEADVRIDRTIKNNLLDFEFETMLPKLEKLTKAPLIIDDTPGLNVFEFRAKCRRLKKIHNIQLIIIDYLQLMDGKKAGEKNFGGNREQEIGTISRTLKMVAKELNVPVIALSQLSRSVESRPGAAKRPVLSDLRESGSIEQDADNVLFLFRPEYYGLTEIDGVSTHQLMQVIWAKHRNGVTETLNLKFNGAYMRVDEFETTTVFPIDDEIRKDLNGTQTGFVFRQPSDNEEPAF